VTIVKCDCGLFPDFHPKKISIRTSSRRQTHSNTSATFWEFVQESAMPTLLYHKFALNSHANVLNTTDSCKELKLFPNQFMNVFRMHRKLQEYETPTMHPTLPQVCDQLAAAHAVWQPIVGLPSPGSS